MSQTGDSDPLEPGQRETVDDAPPQPTIAELFSRLVMDAAAFVRAEIAVYRAEVGQKIVAAGWIIGFLIAAISLVQGAIIALLIGIIMALSPVIGIWWAIVVVIVGALMIAGLLIKIVSAQAASLTKSGKSS